MENGRTKSKKKENCSRLGTRLELSIANREALEKSTSYFLDRRVNSMGEYEQVLSTHSYTHMRKLLLCSRALVSFVAG